MMDSPAFPHQQRSDIRSQMLDYWQNFTPSLENMMLDKKASIIHVDEKTEILQLLAPVLRNSCVLELGAGIGRYTGTLAKIAKNVTAVDFMEDYIAVNKKENAHFTNVNWIAADVLDLKLPERKFNVVFSNWLLMYLNDGECIKLLDKVLHWLSEGGHLFIRESCFHPSGNVRRTSNPTFYRTPADYQNFLESVQVESSNRSQRGEGFHVIEAGSIKSYIKHKNNSYQIYFLSKKMETEKNSKDNYQNFLDKKQYTRQGVLRYEWIFGNTFLSTGGLETTKDFIKQLDLKSGQRVLDVGCGVGGHSFYMAEKYNVEVLGLDLSANMMSVAIEHLAERPHLRNKVKFVMCDITKAKYEENSFDVVYSRDTLLHIEDKEQLFSNFLKWLKPGGKILFTDYTIGEKGVESEDMKKYVAQRGYHLLTTHQYEHLLKDTGFINVQAHDKTNEFLEMLVNELKKLREKKNEFLKEFSLEDYEYLEDGWQAKITRAKSGDQTWTACYGEKEML